MKSPEGYEKDKIKKYLDSINAFHFSPFMGGYSKRGVPDIVACIYGRFWGIEVKREGKKPTPIQRERMNEIIKRGGNVSAGTAVQVIDQLERWISIARAV